MSSMLIFDECKMVRTFPADRFLALLIQHYYPTSYHTNILPGDMDMYIKTGKHLTTYRKDILPACFDSLKKQFASDKVEGKLKSLMLSYANFTDPSGKVLSNYTNIA